MSGGLMQLVAYGVQDTYLTGNPEITYFKASYKRHTQFSIECVQQTWNGAPGFGRTVTCNINRNADLITTMYVVMTLNASTGSGTSWGYVNRLGHAAIDNIKIEIGGSKIDEHYGDWLNIWYELTKKTGQVRGYDKMIGNVPELTNLSTSKKSYSMYVPLRFWFNRDNGLALPLIALQYHEVRVTIVFRKSIDCINWVGASNSPPQMLPSMQDSYLLIDYIYLDSEERQKFAQSTHEYLIEQLQFTGSEALTTNPKYRLNFNHPSKFLIWASHLQKYTLRNEWISFAFGNGNWEEAKNRFAKLLYVGTRKDIREDDGSGTVIEFSSASQKLYVDAGEAADSGDLFEPDVRLGLSSMVNEMLKKIDVKCVNQDTVANDRALIADISTNNNTDIIKEILVNTVVTTNDLTMEDITKTVTELTDINESILELSKISAVNYHNYGNFVDGSDNPIYNAKLQLNGHDRFQNRDGNYFNYVQPYQHFSNTPCDGINTYSFALNPEEHQPSGTCNFSRIDNATLQVDLGLYNRASNSVGYAQNFVGSSSVMNIYTVNYNVLRIMAGMAGTAYSN
jgi:hypothetical protein